MLTIEKERRYGDGIFDFNSRGSYYRFLSLLVIGTAEDRAGA